MWVSDESPRTDLLATKNPSEFRTRQKELECKEDSSRRRSVDILCGGLLAAEGKMQKFNRKNDLIVNNTCILIHIVVF